jgi:hypothetical protein
VGSASDKVLVARALALGFCEDEEDCLGHIYEAARLAAVFTHPHGNLRNGEWVFREKEGKIVDIGLIKCEHCSDSKRIRVYEECEGCDGDGCSICRGEGNVPRWIKCPDCTGSSSENRRR